MRQVDAVGPRVAAHALLLGEHGGVVLGLLEDPQSHGLADVGGDRDGLVRRPVPADADLAAVVATGDQLGADAGGPHVEHVGQPLDHDLGAVVAELAEQGPVEADHPRGAVGDQRAALVVNDEAPLRLTTMSRSDWEAARRGRCPR